MNILDISIALAYFVAMLLIGISHSRKSSGSVRSYFLGDNKGKWWMLAASGAASNFDVAGTMFMVSLFYVVGLHSFWMLWAWALFNSAFLMSYMAVWIRKTGVVTAVELMSARFGNDAGGRMARTAGAILMVTFLVFSIGYAYAGIAKFLPVLIPGLDKNTAQWLAMAIMAVTTAYVTLGGFSGVVLADVIQLVLSSSAGVAIGVMVFLKLDPKLLVTLHSHFSIDLMPHWHLNMPTGYENWNNFGDLWIYLIISGLLLNMGGAGGHYGEQRFLATRSNADAAKAGAAWGLFLVPRWAMVAGFAFLASSGLVSSADPEKILPVVLVDMIPGGFRGLLIAALLAAFMSSFSSTVNAAASMVVRDLVQPAWPKLETKTLIRLSYVATIVLVVVGVAIGTRAESIKAIWIWMLAGVIGATLIPNVLRWHWWRFNGWGYASGIFAGLAATIAIGIGSAFGWFTAWSGPAGLPEYVYAPMIWFVTAVGCWLGSVTTKPTDNETIETFYSRVRPFGFWKPVKAVCSPVTPPNGWRIAANVVLGAIGMSTLYMCVFFLIGHYWPQLEIAGACVLVCVVVLFFTWFKKLPVD